MRPAGFTVWVTGSDPRALPPVADAIAERLAARHVEVEVLGDRSPGFNALGGEVVERRVTYVAGLLRRHGISTVIALSATPAVRAQARTELGQMIEVHVRAAADTAPPEPTEVEIVVPEPSPGGGAERTLRTLEVLQLLPPVEDRGYSEEEEREVIKRLKDFGYL